MIQDHQFPHSFYGSGLPGIELSDLKGFLFALEGLNGAGCSSQTDLIKKSLEKKGYPVVTCLLGQSPLVEPELETIRDRNQIFHRAFFLLQCTAFFDQIEKVIIPALHAGNVVLADRYIFSLMAHARIHGLELEWMRSLFAPAIIPDAVFYLSIPPQLAATRLLMQKESFDFRESGLDIQMNKDIYSNFIQYQNQLNLVYDHLQQDYAFTVIHAEPAMETVTKEIEKRIGHYFSL